jgi:hypothetical protein
MHRRFDHKIGECPIVSQSFYFNYCFGTNSKVCLVQTAALSSSFPSVLMMLKSLLGSRRVVNALSVRPACRLGPGLPKFFRRLLRADFRLLKLRG